MWTAKNDLNKLVRRVLTRETERDAESSAASPLPSLLSFYLCVRAFGPDYLGAWNWLCGCSSLWMGSFFLYFTVTIFCDCSSLSFLTGTLINFRYCKRLRTRFFRLWESRYRRMENAVHYRVLSIHYYYDILAVVDGSSQGANVIHANKQPNLHFSLMAMFVDSWPWSSVDCRVKFASKIFAL